MEGIVECDVLNIIVTIGKVGDSFARRLEIRRRTETFWERQHFLKHRIYSILYEFNTLFNVLGPHTRVCMGKGKNCHIGIEIPLLIDAMRKILSQSCKIPHTILETVENRCYTLILAIRLRNRDVCSEIEVPGNEQNVVPWDFLDRPHSLIQGKR